MSEALYERYKDALRRGHAASLRGRFDEAIAAYAEAASIAPDRAMPQASLAGVLARTGRLSEALAAYEVALARNPEDEASLRGLARCSRSRDGERRPPRRSIDSPPSSIATVACSRRPMPPDGPWNWPNRVADARAWPPSSRACRRPVSTRRPRRSAGRSARSRAPRRQAALSGPCRPAPGPRRRASSNRARPAPLGDVRRSRPHSRGRDPPSMAATRTRPGAATWRPRPPSARSATCMRPWMRATRRWPSRRPPATST